MPETHFRELEMAKERFYGVLESCHSSEQLESLRLDYFGKKGLLHQAMATLRHLPREEIPRAGQWVNNLKAELSAAFEAKLAQLVEQEEQQAIAREGIDISLPGRRWRQGRSHPISQTLEEMVVQLQKMGFVIRTGPDVDSDYYNFEALNIGEDHPARGMQDTFYLSGGMLLRTHTSNVQVRLMESSSPPLRVAAVGRCFRNEDVSARSHLCFHQLEAFYIDEQVSFADLLGTLELFLSALFSEKIQMRCRPSYFPFVEPGLEVDISCLACRGSGCGLCKQSGWLELGGAGLIHPEVLKAGGIDPERHSGFAWGLGVERIAMLKHGIDDIRLFFENDWRFLRQL